MASIDSFNWDFAGKGSAIRRLGPEPDTTEGFPTRWRIFGPLQPQATKIRPVPGTALRAADSLVAADLAAARRMPDSLEVGDQKLAGRDVELAGDTIDLQALLMDAGARPAEGRQAYAVAQVTFQEPTQVILAAGSQHWMRWWIDGRQVLDTQGTGNLIGPARAGNHCCRHRFEPGTHDLVVQVIGGPWGWAFSGTFGTPQMELDAVEAGTWHLLPESGLMRSPRGTGDGSIAICAEQILTDESIECEFDLHSAQGQFGIVLGAQDLDHYYWCYHPRWGQNWRARVFYAVIAKVHGNGHVRGLAMQLMPNVVCHWNAKHTMRVVRSGNRIQMFVDRVAGPMVIDDTYGPGRAGVRGGGDFELRDLKIQAKRVEPAACWPVNRSGKAPWYSPIPDPVDGLIREPCILTKLATDQLLMGIRIRHGPFYSFKDPQARIGFYLSDDGGRTWAPHGEPVLQTQVMSSGIFCLFEPQPGLLRSLESCDGQPAAIFMYRDSTDNGLIWSAPKAAGTAGDWSAMYAGGCTNDPYGSARLSDGTLLVVMLHQYPDLYKVIPDHGEGTWGTAIAQPYATRSTDHGLTWSPPVPMDNAARDDGTRPNSPCGGFSETALAELPGGRVVAVCRPYRSPYSWQTHSDDGGRTWRMACYAPFSLAGGPQMVGTRSGYLALVGRQTGVGLMTSVDGGTNWDAGTLIDQDGWFNGSIVEAEPDVIIVLYYNLTMSALRMQRIVLTEQGPQVEDS